MGDEPKNWWQTAAGLMTAIAALLTAVTGLVLAIHQLKKGDPLASTVADRIDPKPEIAPGHPEDSRTTHSVRQRTQSPPPVNRATVHVPLPAKREYLLGSGMQTGRFVLNDILLKPHTEESDTLEVDVRVLVDGQQQFNFTNSQFELRIDEKPYRTLSFFNDFIPVGQSRDHQILFIIPHGPPRAVLWIREWMSSAEIPLDLATLN